MKTLTLFALCLLLAAMPKSRLAVDAIDQHNRNVAMIEAKHKTDLAFEQERFAKEMKAARGVAMKNGDLSEANAIEGAGKETPARNSVTGKYILYDGDRETMRVSIFANGTFITNGQTDHPYSWEQQGPMLCLNFKTITKIFSVDAGQRALPGLTFVHGTGFKQPARLVPE